MSGNNHGRNKRKEYPMAKPAAARPAAPMAAPAADTGPFLTFTTKLGLVLIVILSIGLSALIAFAPERKETPEPAVAKVAEQETSEEKKPEKPTKEGKKPPEKDPAEKP